MLLIALIAIGCNSTSTTNDTTQIFLGDYHSSAITQDGAVYVWGRNMYGGLGDDSTIDRLTPVDITSQFNLNNDETIVQVSFNGI